VESFRGGSLRSIEETTGLDLLMGEARFSGLGALEVRMQDGSARQLVAETIVINTGARPAHPPVEGLADVGALNSTTIMELDEVPGHLLILGGGYVGLEFGQMFRRFGSRVTIVQRGPQLLGREDADVAAAVLEVLREDGIDVLLDSEARRVERRDGGDGGARLRLWVNGSDGERALDGSHLLTAAGRTPNTEALDLAATGVRTDRRGAIVVNERLETNVPGIYAVGDVKGGPAFTHISYDDYRVPRTTLIEGGQATTTGRLVPYTVFIDPQLGRVGLSETEAQEQGRAVRVARLPMHDVARALEVDEPRGFMKALVDAATGEIVGCAVLGMEGGEIMAMLQIAMMGHVPYSALREGIFAHPTLAESLNNLFASLA
jgi:pyruvate/2-oxoglutarate dehydrogenase complex dihydrolipoamide dehydrogenase (E3) component